MFIVWRAAQVGILMHALRLSDYFPTPFLHQAIIGMNLFGDIMFQNNYNIDANFRTYPSAMMMLFRWASSGYNIDVEVMFVAII